MNKSDTMQKLPSSQVKAINNLHVWFTACICATFWVSGQANNSSRNNSHQSEQQTLESEDTLTGKVNGDTAVLLAQLVVTNYRLDDQG